MKRGTVLGQYGVSRPLYRTATLGMGLGTSCTQTHVMAIPNLFCHIYCGGQLPLTNYRENSPPQPQIEISLSVSHPLQRQVQQSWIICGRNSGIKEVGHSPLPHSRTNLVWPCPQILRFAPYMGVGKKFVLPHIDCGQLLTKLSGLAFLNLIQKFLYCQPPFQSQALQVWLF